MSCTTHSLSHSLPASLTRYTSRIKIISSFQNKRHILNSAVQSKALDEDLHLRGIHTSLHSIAVISSYGYIKKYVHQGGSLLYEFGLTFCQGQEVRSRTFFLTVFSPKYGSLHCKVTLSVNSVQHSQLSFTCHVRLEASPPAPDHNRSLQSIP